MASRTLSTSRSGWPMRVLGSTLITIAVLLADTAGWTAFADRWISDLRAAVVRYAPSGDIVLVDIDPQSLAEVGVWPWPRGLHAELLNAANDLGADRVGFDIDFSSRTDAAEDARFAQALRTSSAETFLATFVQAPSTDPGAFALSMPIEALLQVSWPAGVNLPLDPDGRVRSFTTHVAAGPETFTSMPALLADREIEADLIGIDFSIDADALPRVSYVDLLRQRVDPARIAGKTLIVGATALELRDFFLSPVHGVVSGSTIIALATETLLQRRELRTVGVPLITFVLCIGLSAYASGRWRLRWHVAGLLALALCAEAVALLLRHRAGLSLDTAPLLAVLAGFAFLAILREFGLRKLLVAVSMTEARNSRKILDRVVETGFDGIVIIDARDRILRVNPAAKRMPLAGRAGSAVLQSLSDLPQEVQTAVRQMRVAGGGPNGIGRTLDVCVGATALELSVAPLEMIALGADDAGLRADHVCLTFRDVSEARRSQEILRAQALQDPLTALANRRGLELALMRAHANERSACALMMFDLDRFKRVNDTLGHAVGDDVLIEVGRRAVATLGPNAHVARMGGDEFAALLTGTDHDTANELAQALLTAMSHPFIVRGHRVSIGASIGTALAQGDEWHPDQIVRHADLALNVAKDSASGSNVVFFRPDMEDARNARLALEADLVLALDRGQFELVYQPQVRVGDGAIIGAEALVRWRHPDRGLISPALFIPVAEEMGLIHALGEWVMKAACRDAARWPQAISVAVNVSSIQFDAGDLIALVDEALAGSGLAPGRLEIEITESAFVRESDHLAGTFATLRRRGIGFALDDFGTGYSSLGYLHRFPITKIKIDRQFISGLPTSQSSLAIVRSIMALSHGLSIRTIAEGAETQEQIEALRMLGCREIQGYAYYRPMTDVALQALLQRQAGEKEVAVSVSA